MNREIVFLNSTESALLVHIHLSRFDVIKPLIQDFCLIMWLYILLFYIMLNKLVKCFFCYAVFFS